jgi:hypothetical protein
MADYKPYIRDGILNRDYNASRGKGADNFKRPATDFEDEVRIVYDELMSLLIKKHKDYGPKNIADAPGGAINGLRVRMHDKIARINNLVDNGKTPEYESLEDSFKDLANYSIIALLVLRGKWDK